MEDSSQSGIEIVLRTAFSHMMLEVIIVLVLMFILVMSALYDYRERRIPNILSLSGWLIGPLLHFASSGLQGFYASVLGMVVVLIVTFPMWLLGSVGAGDVKLMTTVGALSGSGKILLILLSVAVAGLFYAVMIILYKWINEMIKARGSNALKMDEEVDADGEKRKSKNANKTIPYAVPIAFGTFAGLLLTYQ